MSNDARRQLLDLVDAALAVTPHRRAAWLDEACGADSKLRAEVESLLACGDDAESLLSVDEGHRDDSNAPKAPVDTNGVVVGTPPDGARLGDFQIEAQIGAGGMGVVYRAKQLSLNRIVALKVLPAYLRSSPSAHARFRREVEAAARLHHDHVVSVFATGDNGANSYYAMELIDGPSLSQVLEQLRVNPIPELQSCAPQATREDAGAPEHAPPHPTPMFAQRLRTARGGESLAETPAAGRSGNNYFDAIADMLAGVADGLAYAHQNQVIHRDIKPSNLLLSNDGRLHISDFGLARIVAEPGMTQTGEFVGTPYYMAPEQVDDAFGEIDGRTDLYSLGATLYELLTLHPPSPGASRDAVLSGVVHRDPTPPKRLNARAPRDLETICMKALEKNPARRYQTAAAMADDLRRYVKRMPITAKRSGAAARATKWCRRHPAVAALLAISFGLGLMAAVLALRANRSALDRVVAEKQRDALEEKSNQIEEDLHAAKSAVKLATQTEQERVFEQALLAAMLGDADAVRDAVRRAQRLGASKGRLHLLRGQIALFAADFQNCLRELERAVALMPTSVAARSLLAETHARLGQWEESRRVLKSARSMPPRSIEDLILKGRMESHHDSKAAEKTLDLAVAQDKRNIAARLVRGVIRAKRAYDEVDPIYAERALEDFDLASTLLEETPYLLSEQLSAHLTAASAYEAAEVSDRNTFHMTQAKQLADKLGAYNGDYQAHRWRAYFFDQVGDLDQAAAEWKAIDDKTIGFLIMTLYRSGQFDEALVACDEYEAGALTGTSDFCHSFVLAATCDSPDKLVADFRFDRLVNWNLDSAWRSAFILWCLAGNLDQAEEEVRRIGVADDSDSKSRLRFDFLRGAMTSEEYLRRTQNSRYEYGRAHLVIGVKRLARGDRAVARSHFEQAVQQGLTYEFFTAMSRAFLAQLERDPKWPRWIGQKSSADL